MVADRALSGRAPIGGEEGGNRLDADADGNLNRGSPQLFEQDELQHPIDRKEGCV